MGGQCSLAVYIVEPRTVFVPSLSLDAAQECPTCGSSDPRYTSSVLWPLLSGVWTSSSLRPTADSGYLISDVTGAVDQYSCLCSPVLPLSSFAEQTDRTSQEPPDSTQINKEDAGLGARNSVYRTKTGDPNLHQIFIVNTSRTAVDWIMPREERHKVN
ncbi:hypothetical protein BDW60DRAFT_60218 [Aspergillus nidulans var. acristatus]